MVKLCKISTTCILTGLMLLSVACSLFVKEGNSIPFWYAKRLLDNTGEYNWSLVNDKCAQSIAQKIRVEYMDDRVLPDVLENARLKGTLNVKVLESELFITTIWFVFPEEIVGHVVFEDFCYQKSNKKQIFSGYSMIELDKISEEGKNESCPVENFPNWYVGYIRKHTEATKWRLVDVKRVSDIAKKTKGIFLDNDLWTEDMEIAEGNNKLNVVAFESGELIIIVWFYFEDSPIRHVIFKDYCSNTSNGTVVFSGDGVAYSDNHTVGIESAVRDKMETEQLKKIEE